MKDRQKKKRERKLRRNMEEKSVEMRDPEQKHISTYSYLCTKSNPRYNIRIVPAANTLLFNTLNLLILVLRLNPSFTQIPNQTQPTFPSVGHSSLFGHSLPSAPYRNPSDTTSLQK
ncbi:hypothetical protein, unlikely [Trypanosoma brucei gambiense DAL972]|uniref:Uncharacterized protein n=1 Tax=Trypanosoma brucei gambiense (strain MHOM/CI/86/DAL972) TaxID=679716 RepID=C9ZLL8_TRYB9|nr:hypothetical protein, unlikely [Trypanosoma brucei gambiense DAL972]CBH10227.1 hypothetical protein, unlikely [Trypanosoma brucei gambiense DAL972]|eukprot:XP_011772517.1 hypothetical protein, unlikely [Trypanosoma brucei gambiense DAL972]